MTRNEALKICQEALEKHEGGKEAYFSILEDLIRLSEYEEGEEDELGNKETEFHCGIEESGFHAYNCNDCPNKCEVYYQWDKEMKND